MVDIAVVHPVVWDNGIHDLLKVATSNFGLQKTNKRNVFLGNEAPYFMVDRDHV